MHQFDEMFFDNHVILSVSVILDLAYLNYALFFEKITHLKAKTAYYIVE